MRKHTILSLSIQRKIEKHQPYLENLQGRLCPINRGRAPVAPLAAAGPRQELLHHLIDGEARRLLAWWVLNKCVQEIANELLRRQEQVNVINYPVPVGVRGDVRPLEGVCAQVEELRKPQGHQRFLPDSKGALPLLSTR